MYLPIKKYYLGAGLLVAILGGLLIGKLKLEKSVEEYVYTFHNGQE